MRSSAAVASDDARAQRSPAPRAVTRGERYSVSIDAVSIVAFPPDGHWRHGVAHFLKANFGVSGFEQGGGWRGYECSARVGGVIVAWGGEGQRGTVLIDIPGSVCAACSDWSAVREWLEVMNARLSRVDIAGDDFEGESVNLEWARSCMLAGGFSNGGRPPSFQLITNFQGEGDTLYVGKRGNGKLARIYEKGKQLGDPLSGWCRFEVEFRSKDRVLPLDMLTRPGAYLAGAFPCVAFFAGVRESLRTSRERVSVSLGRAVEVARLHCGRVVNAVLLTNGGDVGDVVSLLRRSGLPRRLNAADMTRLLAA
jgi:phage replication initiation protein